MALMAGGLLLKMKPLYLLCHIAFYSKGNGLSEQMASTEETIMALMAGGGFFLKMKPLFLLYHILRKKALGLYICRSQTTLQVAALHQKGNQILLNCQCPGPTPNTRGTVCMLVADFQGMGVFSDQNQGVKSPRQWQKGGSFSAGDARKQKKGGSELIWS